MQPTSTGWPAGDGEMAVRIRGHDWAATPLRSIGGWSGRLRALIDLMLASPLVSSLVCGPDRVLIYNDASARLYGTRHPAALGRPLPETFPEGWSTVAPLYERAFSGEAAQVAAQALDTRGEGPAASDRFDAYLTPVREEDGSIAYVHMTGFEMSGKLAAEAALRRNEELFRSFAETSADTLWILDAATRRLEYLSPAFERIWGETREAVMADLGRWQDLVHPDDRAAAARGLPRVLRGETFVNDYRIVRPSDGAVCWIRDTGFPIRDDEGRVRRIGGIAQDVTDQRRALEHQALLLAELQHRVRNTLAVVRSIARRTGETSETVEDYAMHLDGRLDAFARVQAAVTRDPSAGIDLEQLVANELLAHGAHENDQVRRIKGPPVRLRPKAAETLALAVHELATNAVKYGALSSRTGRVAVDWALDDGDGRGRLVFRWVESGVKLSDPQPRRRGFGTELIERTLEYELGGEASLSFGPGGFRCEIKLPLDENLLVTGDGQGAADGGAVVLLRGRDQPRPA